MNKKSGNVTVVSRNVCSKLLFKEINGALIESIRQIGVKWANDSHRTNFIEAIDEYLGDIDEEDNKRIVQHKVVCNKQNNPQGFSGKNIRFELHYKQKHCLNFTIIEYHIET